MNNDTCLYAVSCSIVDSISVIGGSLLDGIGSSAVELGLALPWFWPLVAAMVGAVLASFAGVVVDRLPVMRGWNGRKPSAAVTLSHPDSHCDGCGEAIPKPYLVPILGWVWARGRCTHCREVVPAKYPVIEGLSALLSMTIVAVAGPGPYAIALCVLLWSLLPVAWIDWNEHEIPDLLTVPIAAVGLIFSPFEPDAMARIVGMVIAASGMWAALKLTARWKGVDTDAYGDVALCAAGGAWVGICGVPAFLLLASLSYVAYAVPVRRVTKEEWVPLGPALAVGMLATAAFGLQIT